MKKFISIENFFYIFIFFICLFNCTSNNITNYSEAYNVLINTEVLTSIYIPFFVFVMAYKLRSFIKIPMLIRYVKIDNWLSQIYSFILKVSFFMALLILIINYVLFCIINTGIIVNINSYLYLLCSFFFQFIGWIFIGSSSIFLMSLIKKTNMAFLLYFCIILIIKSLKSELSMFRIGDYIIPIWQIMLMHSDNITYDIGKQFGLGLVAILCSIVFFYITKLLLKNSDFNWKG